MKKKREKIEELVVEKNNPSKEELFDVLSEEDKLEYDTAKAKNKYFKILSAGCFVACAGLALYNGYDILGAELYDSTISFSDNLVYGVSVSTEYFFSKMTSSFLKIAPMAIGWISAIEFNSRAIVSEEKANYILNKSNQENIKRGFLESIALKSAKKKAQKRQSEVQEMPEIVESQDINKYENTVPESVVIQVKENNSYNFQ